jgi:hypothetical protein
MTEDEARTVARVAAECVWGGRRYLGLIMRYGRLFTPGREAGGGAYPMIPAWAGKNAYQQAMDRSLLYAEGYACVSGAIVIHSAWCLDGEIVIDPGFKQPRTAYFGLALRSSYMRRVHEARRHDDGGDGFTKVFIPPLENNPPLDPGADIVLDIGRDIPPRVRDWALTAESPSGGDPVAPAWVLDELLRFDDRRPPDPDPYLQPLALPAEQRVLETVALQGGRDTAPTEAPLPMSYARYLVRRDDALDSGMSLHCSGRTGGVFSDNGSSLTAIQDGDSLDTLIRMADEHRPRCEWAVCPDDERDRPELTVQKRAEVHLRWGRGFEAGRSFAVLHRLDYNVWDAWLHPFRMEGQVRVEEQPVLVTRNGVSYEMALMAVFRAMGDDMPEDFAVYYQRGSDRNQGDR